MITFKNYLNESTLTIYHGDNFGLVNVNQNYARMYGKSSNVQEGIGIYFSNSLDVAKGYGSKLVETTVNTSNLLPSRAIVADKITLNTVVNLLKEIANAYDEFWLLFTDYGYEVSNNSDITNKMYIDLAKLMSDNEIRNFQIELVQASDIEIFVNAWLKIVKKHGTYNKELGFYALMKSNPIKTI